MNFNFSIDGKKLNLVKETVVNVNRYSLPGENWVAGGHFGEARFQVFSAEGFDLWYNRYEAAKDFELSVEVDAPLLVFRAQLSNDVECFCNGIELGCREGQYEMIAVPHGDAAAKFSRGRTYETFVIQFKFAFLKPYAGSSPQLANFLQKVEENKPARLLEGAGFLTPSMEDGIRTILGYKGELAARFIECRVHELLILLIHHLSLSDKLPQPDQLEINKAEAVKKMIADDLSRLYKVETLARKVHTTEPKLQATFKHLYGTTVGKFSRELHLKRAHELLSDASGPRETLLSIALSVGYNDVANFANAFKQHFGYPPGAIYKRVRGNS